MMQALTLTLKQKLTFILLSTLIVSTNFAMAKSDTQAVDDQQAQETAHQKGDHSKHSKEADEDQKYRGVYYGYVPCKKKDCAGIKMTLSLKNKRNYLLVTQNAQASSREYYEKGKYNWDDKAFMVTLKSRKKLKISKFRIKDADTLVFLDEKGLPMKGKEERYTLRKADQQQSTTRQSHNH